MMQGDSYSLSIEVLKEDGSIVTNAEVADMEIIIGSLRKTYLDGEVTYDSTSQTWRFPLSQEETFRYLPSRVKGQVRVKWLTGEVEGVPLDEERIRESLSKEVL